MTEKIELSFYVKKALSSLDNDEKIVVSIVKDYYGIDTTEPLSMVQIVNKYSMPYTTIVSYPEKCLRMLRHPKYSRMLIDYR